jgi:hypothetical protein
MRAKVVGSGGHTAFSFPGGRVSARVFHARERLLVSQSRRNQSVHGPLTALPQAILDSGKPTMSKGRHPREWFGLDESWRRSLG